MMFSIASLGVGSNVWAGMMCPVSRGDGGSLWCFGLMLFLVVWIVAVPVIITSRLEKIIKLLEDKK